MSAPPDRKRKLSTIESRGDEGPTQSGSAVTVEGDGPTYVTEINENDILMGRGKPIISNEGNKRFRELVRSRKEEYSSTSRTHIKEAIAREIIQEISNRNGRFLEPVQRAEATAAGFPDKSKVWRIVYLKIALNKVKQSLRDREYVRSDARVASPQPFSLDPTANQPIHELRPGLQPTLHTGLGGDNQRALELMQQQVLLQQEQAMLLRAQQVQNLQGFNPALAMQQNLAAAHGIQNLPGGYPLGINLEQLGPGQPNIGGPGANSNIRDFLLSRQLLMGQNPLLLGGGLGSYGVPQQMLAAGASGSGGLSGGLRHDSLLDVSQAASIPDQFQHTENNPDLSLIDRSVAQEGDLENPSIEAPPQRDDDSRAEFDEASSSVSSSESTESESDKKLPAAS